jgi:hypothetical protein
MATRNLNGRALNTMTNRLIRLSIKFWGSLKDEKSFDSSRSLFKEIQATIKLIHSELFGEPEGRD